MRRTSIDRVGVLGAGIMGSGIACHLANAGLEVVLLDIPPPDGKGGRNAFAEKAIAAALKTNPKPLFHASRAERIKTGNLEDHLELLSGCQWVIEAVKEDLAIKRALYARVEKVTSPTTIVSSNTSGLPLASLTEGRSAEFKKRFMITHFFNPPRYLRLVELVKGPDTDPEIAARTQEITEDLLGKGVVWAKDTPNFIANRIGTYGMMRVFKEMEAQNASVEEIDAIFGPALGRPKSAAFRTADMVGLDLLVAVAQNCYDHLPNDPERDIYKPPTWLIDMVKAGQLGQKSGGGFYKKVKKSDANPEGLEVWDIKERRYRPSTKVRIESLGKSRNIDDVAARIKMVTFAEDRAGKIAWPVMRDSLAYSASRIPEIADDTTSVDDALKWGFAWDLGPFETWDALGFEETTARMKKEGASLPAWVDEAIRGGKKSIRAARPGTATPDPRRVSLADRKKAGAKVVMSNSGASVIDIGDGAFAIEFHTKGNAIDGDVLEMIDKGIGYAEGQGRAVVIYNEAENFSYGANLMLIFMLAQQSDWAQIDKGSQAFQQAAQRIRYAKVPAVVAPHGMALGGGCELCLGAGSAAGVRPMAELYIGLVEVGVGVIPAGGGTMNALFNVLERIPEGVEIDPLPFVGQVFKQIALAQVSTSVEEAKALGYIPVNAVATFDRRRLLHDAKAYALGLAEAGYRPPVPRAFRLPGESGVATMSTMVRSMVQAGQATEHDAKIATKLAGVLCGGPAGHTRRVTEQEVLDLEREAFLSLVGEPKTQERISHMLMHNKPLRN